MFENGLGYAIYLNNRQLNINDNLISKYILNITHSRKSGYFGLICADIVDHDRA